jgi:hypothetical protein
MYRAHDGSGAVDVRMLARMRDPPFRHHERTTGRPSRGGLCGIDGMLTGNPITGLGIVDDPIKSRAEADSAVYRERVWDSSMT